MPGARIVSRVSGKEEGGFPNTQTIQEIGKAPVV